MPMGKRARKPPVVLICLKQQGPRWRMLRDRTVAIPEWKNFATGMEQLSEDEMFVKFLLDRFEKDLEAKELGMTDKKQNMEIKRSSSTAKTASNGPTSKGTQECAKSKCSSELSEETLKGDSEKNSKLLQSGTKKETLEMRAKITNVAACKKVTSKETSCGDVANGWSDHAITEMEDNISTYHETPQKACQELPEICLDFPRWFCPENELPTETTDKDSVPSKTSDTRLIATAITAVAEIPRPKNKHGKKKEGKHDGKRGLRRGKITLKKKLPRTELDDKEREAMEFNKSLRDIQEDDLPQMFSCRSCGDHFQKADDVRMHTVTAHLPVSVPQGSETITTDVNGKLQLTHIEIDLGLYQQVNEVDIQELAVTLRRCPHCMEYVENVKTHMDVHMLKNYICEVCGKGFASSKQLKAHGVYHKANGVDGMPYSCDFCSKTFRTKQSLCIHRPLHNKARNYVCQFCGKAFKANTRLQKHLGTHDKRKRYCCTFCGRGFVQKCNMTRHERTHTGVKPYPCHKCNQAFNHNISLKKHLKKEHLITLDERNLQNIQEIDDFPTRRMPLKRAKLK